MGRRAFEVSTGVSCPPGAVVDLLADLSRHRPLHPYLVSAEVVAEGSDRGGDWQEWEVLERPRLGPLRYPVRFRARLTRTRDGLVHRLRSEVWVGGGVRLDAVTVATPVQTGTRLTERTVVTAPRPVLGYVVRQAHAAHRTTYDRLPGVLGSSG